MHIKSEQKAVAPRRVIVSRCWPYLNKTTFRTNPAISFVLENPCPMDISAIVKYEFTPLKSWVPAVSRFSSWCRLPAGWVVNIFSQEILSDLSRQMITLYLRPNQDRRSILSLTIRTPTPRLRW